VRPSSAALTADPATLKERAEQMVLLQGEPTEAFEWFKVDRAIGNVRDQSPELIKPSAAEHPAPDLF